MAQGGGLGVHEDSKNPTSKSETFILTSFYASGELIVGSFFGQDPRAAARECMNGAGFLEIALGACLLFEGAISKSTAFSATAVSTPNEKQGSVFLGEFCSTACAGVVGAEARMSTRAIA
jgi:hypothetical protein